MVWITVTLSILSSLPFILSWYQIKNSSAAIVDQAQKSHMIIARATADRVGSFVNKYFELSKSLGNNASIYLEPDSTVASDLLKATLLSQSNILAIGLTLKQDGGQSEIIQMLKRNNATFEGLEKNITNDFKENITLISTDNQDYVLVKNSTARPKVNISLIINVDFKKFLKPQILGESARLSLIHKNGDLIAHSNEVFTPILPVLIQQISSGLVDSAVSRIIDSETKNLTAFAAIENTSWSIVSRQPLKFAELATSKMITMAWRVFAIVLAIMSALIFFAYYSWIKPIRKIVKLYQNLIGNNNSHWRGSEVTALEKSFDTLSKHMNDRNKLSQVFVDRYQVICPIGVGGMGAVFLGWDPRLKRHVALKTLPIHSSFGSREDMSQTLVQEAITAAKISHSNVVSIYDVVSTTNAAFIAMEYVDGESLYSLIQREKKISLSNTMSVAIAIAKGLKSAHELGFVHRDIKPENILLGINGDIKLTDFGTTALLRSLEQDDVTGTPGYIAPETYQSGEVSVQSDLFSLGVVLATCLLGRNPFQGKNQQITKKNTLNKKVEFSAEVRQQHSEEIFVLIHKILDKNPKNRPTSATDLIDSIRKVALNIIKWDAELIGIQSSKENVYAESEFETAINPNFD